MTAERTDACLVACICEGDLDALGELYERHRNLVFRTALAITHDERMAEDILQEVFLRVYTYAERIDETLPLEPWLYRVTVNQTYSWMSRARRLIYVLHDVLDRWSSPVSSQWPSPAERIAEERETWQHLQKAIDALPRSHRVVVVLHYLEELSLQEIAGIMDIPEGTVKSRLYYARRKLREAMKEEERRLVPEVAYDFT
jgi:RNA polymerase sigma-70 factor (ECF subfamily)